MKLTTFKTVRVLFIYLLFISNTYASEKATSHKEEQRAKSQQTHTSEHEHDHDHEGDHGHQENILIGPGKGIVSANEVEGIQISSEAEKNFEIKRMFVPTTAQLKIPRGALVTSGIEVNIYRYRQNHYKRIDVILIEKTKNQVTIKSKDLKPGDEIVTRGMGLLRIAEIAAFGGAPEGHSH